MQITLPKFEGPLALLLYLIRKEEMDIMDIKIHEITSQYLEHVKLMKELDLEVAGEFIAMASTLIHIKSRMLLPQYNEDGEIIETEDPRKELVQKLLEYQKYQEASRALYERPLVGRDVWLRGFRETLDSKEEEIEVDEQGLFALISIYRRVMKTAKKRVHRVAGQIQSIASRILEIKDLLILNHRVALRDLVTSVEEKTRQTLITFLSLLELGKLGFVSLYQSEVYSDIWVETKKTIELNVISRVEEYESVNSEEVADSLFARSSAQLAADEISLADEEEAALENPPLPLENFALESLEVLESEDMASDDDILAAEAELEQQENSEIPVWSEISDGELKMETESSHESVEVVSLDSAKDVTAVEKGSEPDGQETIG